MIKDILVKTILSKIAGVDNFFGFSYSMNLYRGCQHACIYCDTRSECYGINNISQINVKKNALELLNSELGSKRTKGTIGTGSMDPYMPIEKELKLTRRALQIIESRRFPVHVITKSCLVQRDYDILQDLSKTYVAVTFTITTANDNLSRIIEPNAPVSSERFKAMSFLSQKGIYTGISLMPLLPFINDTAENVELILQQAKNAGASYVIPMFGMTLRKGSREYYYQALDRKFPNLKEKYISSFGSQYMCYSPNYKQLESFFKMKTNELKLKRNMEFYKNTTDTQLSLF